MKLAARLRLHGICIAVILFFATTISWAEEYSHARIVRLSFVEGVVTVQRPDVEEWAAALVNTPIQEGFKVSTAEDGFAEVEFENASTARLGQLSLLEFTQLVLAPSGGKINRLTLYQGYATFNFIPEDHDFYEVTAGDATLTPHGKTRFRLDVEAGLLLVKVFKGSVEITSPEGTGTVGENAMLELRTDAEPVFQITQGITKDAWDEWVEDREEVAQAARGRGAPMAASAGITDLLFGFMDLTLYGDWYSHPDYGNVWYPFPNSGWNPYATGRWCWYPGFGYTWISAEPWGWLPYHYGHWVYDPRIGWCWIPGNLSTWSPAQVTWYRGPGWVGWAPGRSRRSAGGAPESRGGVAVSEDTFRNGRPVRPGRILGIDPETEGRLIERPDIDPGRLARLPGEPYRRAGVPELTQEPRQAGVSVGRGSVRPRLAGAAGVNSAGGASLSTSPARESGVRSRTETSTGSVVFDPEERRYINGPAPGRKSASDSARQTAPSEGEGRSQATPQTSRVIPGEGRGTRPSVETLVDAHRPGPQGNYPARVANPRHAGVEEHTPISPGISPAKSVGSVDRGSRGASSHLGTQGSWSSQDRSSRPSTSVRSAPDSGSRSSGSASSHVSSGRDSGSQRESRSSSDYSGRSGSASSSGSSRSSTGGSGGSSDSRGTHDSGSRTSSSDSSSRSSDSGSHGSSHSSVSVDRGSSSRDDSSGGSRGGSGDSHSGSGGRPPR